MEKMYRPDRFAAGRTTALVVDSGASGTSVVPVYDGYVLKKGTWIGHLTEYIAIFKAPIGGDFVSDQVKKQLRELKIDIVPHYKVASKQPVDSASPPNYVSKETPDTAPSFHELATEVHKYYLHL
jgi:actin-related protein